MKYFNKLLVIFTLYLQLLLTLVFFTLQKIRELELIDKERSKELNLAEQQEWGQKWQIVWSDQLSWLKKIKENVN